MQTQCGAAMLVCAFTAMAQELPFPDGFVASGAALDGKTVAVWGNALLRVDLETKECRRISSGAFAGGGCIADVDEDGRPDIVVQETRGVLVWFQAPDWKRRVIDRAEVADAAFTRIHDRRGVVAVHRGRQVRFYQAPQTPDEPWLPRDLYSFYSTSDQGGLLFTDIDRDGRTDITCGNYWMQNPEDFGWSWRLYAIKLWAEEEHSALTSFALLPDGNLAACQRAMRRARLAWYRRPADPKQLWEQHVLAEDLDQPATLLARGMDLVVAERGSRGRILLWRASGGGFEKTPHVIREGVPVVQAWLAGRELLAVEPGRLIRIDLP